MNTIELNREQFRELVWEGLEDFEPVEQGDWKVSYKWQHCSNIVKQISTGKFFEYSVSRSGSPYSDYYYSYEDGGVTLQEVQQVEEVTVKKVWKPVE